MLLLLHAFNIENPTSSVRTEQCSAVLDLLSASRPKELTIVNHMPVNGLLKYPQSVLMILSSRSNCFQFKLHLQNKRKLE